VLSMVYFPRVIHSLLSAYPYPPSNIRLDVTQISTVREWATLDMALLESVQTTRPYSKHVESCRARFISAVVRIGCGY
jgi:hypothetical protein